MRSTAHGENSFYAIAGARFDDFCSTIEPQRLSALVAEALKLDGVDDFVETPDAWAYDRVEGGYLAWNLPRTYHSGAGLAN